MTTSTAPADTVTVTSTTARPPGDHPAFIKAMHDFLAANAAPVGTIDPAGKVIYDVYPQAAATYQSLTWASDRASRRRESVE